MIEMNRILIPTDFSELATHALRYACEMSRICRAELHVMHVVPPAGDLPVVADGGAGVGVAGIGAGIGPLEFAREQAKLKKKELESHVADISRSLPIAPVPVLRTGLPWQEIVRYADEAAIDLIVIGSHARGIMKRILLGSTSKAVLEHVARPVMMVPIAAMTSGEEIVGAGIGAESN